jgi:Leucine-rich repeat (LRR) protein
MSLRQYNSSYFDVDTLNLAKNFITTIRTGTIKGKFTSLNLEDNSIEAFEQNSFGDMPNLKEISFKGNLIKKLNFSMHAFQRSLKNLLKLNFNSNKIVSIDGDFFRKFPNINHLDLSKNNFFSLQAAYLLNLANLKYLDLSSNQILTIETSTFENLNQLTRLNLANNLIYALNGGLFRKLKNLIELNLARNKIETCSREFFKGLDSLELLNLADNQIGSLNNDSFMYVKNLTTLALSSNKKLSIKNNYNILNGSLNMINYLDLSNMNLSKVYLTNLFKFLVFLDLSHNKLSSSQDFNTFSLVDLKVKNKY